LIVQSFTLTTVLIVPLAGAGIFTLAQVYPFTLGANLGTAITALMAATAITGEYPSVALQVAIVHFHYTALANGARRSPWIVPG
jgi:solute carrier family 34 (sodium-dependent phosphate cotransporter)